MYFQMAALEGDRDCAKKAERVEDHEIRIAFEILSAVRLSWWADALFNLSGLYMAVVSFYGALDYE